ncbi:YhgE/Pip family protein [Actinoalloteichus hymeniacidonis]|uniref:YhgE/Pip-like protein n=1 Tax=Actinoalloteichus hymeniacidonis TaxID=340345 RepID=A0AAC9HP40_9PSEU|nr:YhgE/Pip family protein [Actinoalloteichus hymeniacidonis]AOS62860.1 YhgE/Pip-like protein [Actinoalloteichus hymeniacidonis]MBB5909107.1 putative membrane protein [Actinoalloteichus hymeniacidonis]
MSARRLASIELRRLATGRITRLALVAALFVPLVFGALSIYANWDPYQRLSSVPAAIVMADDGAIDTEGRTLDAGMEVEEQLIAAGDFDWHRVTSEEADRGVASGRFGFALVVPPDFSSALLSHAALDPRSARLTVITNDANDHLVGTVANQLAERIRSTVATQVGTETADRLLLDLSTAQQQTADAAAESGYLTELTARLVEEFAIAEELLAETAALIEEELAQAQDRSERFAELTETTGVATEAAEALAAVEADTETVRAQLASAADQATELGAQAQRAAAQAADTAAGTESAAETGSDLAETTGEIAIALPTLRTELTDELTRLGVSSETLDAVLETLDDTIGRTDRVDDTAAALAESLAELVATHQADGDTTAALAETAHRLASSIGPAEEHSSADPSGVGAMADGTLELADALSTISADVAELAAQQELSTQAAGTLAEHTALLTDGAGALMATAEELDEDTVGLAEQLAEQSEVAPTPDAATRQVAARTIASPVTVTDRAHLTAGSHGAGLAPLFLGLALWVGAVVSYLLLQPLSARALAANVPAWRVALGGWLPAAVLGVAQALLLFATTVLVIGLPATRPWAILGLLVVTALAFTAIAHALCALFGPAGRLISLVALILQLTTAGSAFPWSAVPDATQPLHRMLPLGYVVEGLRHLLYGTDIEAALLATAVCLCWLGVAFLVAVTAAMSRRVWTPSRLRPEIAW